MSLWPTKRLKAGGVCYNWPNSAFNFYGVSLGPRCSIWVLFHPRSFLVSDLLLFLFEDKQKHERLRKTKRRRCETVGLDSGREINMANGGLWGTKWKTLVMTKLWYSVYSSNRHRRGNRNSKGYRYAEFNAFSVWDIIYHWFWFEDVAHSNNLTARANGQLV